MGKCRAPFLTLEGRGDSEERFISGRVAEAERELIRYQKGFGPLVLRLIVGLGLLGWPTVGNAQGKWSVIPVPRKSGEIVEPREEREVEAGLI